MLRASCVADNNVRRLGGSAAAAARSNIPPTITARHGGTDDDPSSSSLSPPSSQRLPAHSTMASAVIVLWREIVGRLRECWEARAPLAAAVGGYTRERRRRAAVPAPVERDAAGVPLDLYPDHSVCLLQQKLQLLACCIRCARWQEEGGGAARADIDGREGGSDNDSDDIDGGSGGDGP